MWKTFEKEDQAFPLLKGRVFVFLFFFPTGSATKEGMRGSDAQ